jgi:8-oxo-dGTP pyrophosphatase MutT (NUDIX family)
VTSSPPRGGAQVIPRPDVWRLGDPAPWAGQYERRRFDLELVLEALGARRPAGRGTEAPVFPQARPSAVLVAMHDGAEGAELILTRRSWALRNHRGEVSFPGGRLEPGETPEAGALREAHEEILLEPSTVELIGRLPTLATVVSMSHIVPVVGRLIARPQLQPATAEVDRILHVPLAELAQPDVFREERWGRPPLDRPIYFFELEDETIWGATARIIVDLLDLVLMSSR